MPFGLNMSLGALQGKPILCRKCGQGGGTLKKVKKEMNQEEVIYTGRKERTSEGGMLVLRNGFPFSPGPSQRLINHSPDGFNWSYWGSGPAQLALALLLDITHNPSLAIAKHQQYKFEVIGKLQDGWEITSTEIENWLKGAGNAYKRIINTAPASPAWQNSHWN
jgi:hypothetical protein